MLCDLQVAVVLAFVLLLFVLLSWLAVVWNFGTWSKESFQSEGLCTRCGGQALLQQLDCIERTSPGPDLLPLRCPCCLAYSCGFFYVAGR